MSGEANELTERERQVQEQLNDAYLEALDHVKVVLQEEIDSRVISQRVYERAFKPNEVFPKRSVRPDLKVSHFSRTVAEGYGLTGEERDTIVQLGITFNEYCNVVDDVLDDDVAEGHEDEALFISHMLVPALVRLLARIGTDAVDRWAGHVTRMGEAVLLEEANDPSPETYLEVVDKTGSLWGNATGVAALAAGEDETGIERAERLGTLFFKIEEFRLDTLQEAKGDEFDYEEDDPWNAAALFPEDELMAQIEEWRAEFEDLAGDLRDDQAEALRQFIAFDVDDTDRFELLDEV
ncbi:hypothetical protein BRC83_02950 [Halobacteriales archaeon QS_1_68_17]|nr:MAG: hypothetical protein BRC83_02950 [Halobacteriales archaeon QS_1_68_17]